MISDYTYEVLSDDRIIIIEDLNLGNATVTNNIENVVTEIARKHDIDLDKHKIIYADSIGLWDGFDWKNRRFIPLATDNRKVALERIKNKI